MSCLPVYAVEAGFPPSQSLKTLQKAVRGRGVFQNSPARKLRTLSACPPIFENVRVLNALRKCSSPGQCSKDSFAGAMWRRQIAPAEGCASESGEYLSVKHSAQGPQALWH